MSALPITTGRDDNLRRSLAVSTGLHVLGLLFLFFGLPVFMKPLPTPSMPVPLEIVDISDITNTRIKEQPEETPQPPPPPPKPEQKIVTPPPQPQPPQPPEPPKPEVAKTEQVEALVPKPAVKPMPPTPPAPPKPVAKPQPDMLASVLKNVEKLKTAPQVKTPDAKLPTKEQTQAPPKSAAPSLSDRLTISEEDALRRQIELHWNVPIGARDVENMVVEVHIDVNPDRTVQGVEVIDKSRMVTDPYFRAVAESVVRAIYASSPLEVPDGKYEQWKGINSFFSAKDML